MQLPIAANCAIKTYQYNAFSIGAHLAATSNKTDAITNNFIHLESKHSIRHQAHPLYFLPFIGPTTFSRVGLGEQVAFGIFNTSSDFIEAIAHCIETGYYIRLLVDEYYIPDRLTYMKVHQIHDVLIHGIYVRQGQASIAGYCDDGRYRTTTCSLKCLCEGYFSGVTHISRTAFLAFKPTARGTDIDMQKIKHYLYLFISGGVADCSETGGLRSSNDTGVHGIFVFDPLEEYIRSHQLSWYLDIRPFSVLLEHCRAMHTRSLKLIALLNLRCSSSHTENATKTAYSLMLLCLLPLHRRSMASMAEMARLCRRLKHECAVAAELLWEAIT